MGKIDQNKPKQGKKLVLLVVVGLILPLALTWLIVGKASQHSDSLRFAEASEKQQLVFNQLIEKIGSPIAIEEKNICYNSEQGPYDNGRLWCQVASAAYFSEETPEAEIITNLKGVIAANGWRYESLPNTKPGFEGAKDLSCNLEVRSGKLATSTPYYFSDIEDSDQTVLIVCIDRAKAKHYPYVGS